MTLHLGLPYTNHRNHEQQQEIRDAKKMLRDRVRDDWDFPALPQYRKRSCPLVNVAEKVDAVAVARLAGVGEAQDGIAGFRIHSTCTAQNEEMALDVDAVEWRERDYTSEEVDGEESLASSLAQKIKVKAKKVDYQFEGPDSVGPHISSRREARRRRRQHVLLEETRWNEGLEHWLRRRDLWCAARTKAQVDNRERPDGNDSSKLASTDGDSSSLESANGASPRTSTSTAATTSTIAESSPTYASTSTTPDLDASPQASPPQQPRQYHIIMVPVMPQILPNHPIRCRITPSMYSEIYTKIIMQSRTPAVPINLQVLICALVKGWKDDGEWPPKPGVPETSVARKKSSTTVGAKGEGGSGGFRNGVKAVGRVLRLTGTTSMSAS